MNTLRTLLILAVLLAGSLFASTEEVTLVGLQLDSSGALVDRRPESRDDRRDNVALFGHTPTLVVIAASMGFHDDDAKDYLKALKRLDKLAAKWRRDGFDVAFIEPCRYERNEAQRDRKKDDDFVRRAKPKHLYCARRVEGAVFTIADTPALDVLLDTRFSDRPEYRWALLGSLGRVEAAGDDVFADEVEELRESLAAPELLSNSTAKRIFEAINEWRLGEAQVALAKLEEGRAAERHAEAIAQLHELIARSEAHYRAVFVAPHLQRGCLADAADALERLAEHYAAGGPLADAVNTELAELRAGEAYSVAVRQRERFLEVSKAYDEMEVETERVYEEAMGKDGGYDEAEYNRAIREVYPATIATLQAYVEAEQDSPYVGPVKWMLITAKEDLAYAQ